MKKILSILVLGILTIGISACEKRTKTQEEVLTMKDKIGNINEEKSNREIVDELNEEYQDLKSEREKNEAGIEKLDTQSSLMGDALDQKFKISEIDETLDMLPQMKIKAGLFSHSGFNFKINFPEDWTTSRNVLGAILMIMSPKENNEDEFQENITVVVENVPSVYAKETTDSYSKQALVELKKNLEGFKLLKNQDILLHGEKAKALEYTIKKEDKTLRINQVILLFANRAYAITYTAQNEDFKKYLPIYKNSLKSFQFLSKLVKK